MFSQFLASINVGEIRKTSLQNKEKKVELCFRITQMVLLN